MTIKSKVGEVSESSEVPQDAPEFLELNSEDIRWKQFGSWLRRRRRSLGLSQEESAMRAGVSSNHWSRYETGRSGVRRNKVEGVAQAMQVSPAVIYQAAGFAPSENVKTQPTDANPRRRYVVQQRKGNTVHRVILTTVERSEQGLSLLATKEDIERFEYAFARLDNIEDLLTRIERKQNDHDAFASRLIAVLCHLASVLSERSPQVMRRLFNRIVAMQHGSTVQPNGHKKSFANNRHTATLAKP